jgi:hypothetical protein
MDVVAADAPLRLLLGSDAVHLAEQSSRSRAPEAAVWVGGSRSTDVDSAWSLPRLHLPRLTA